jgi:hypothetical protein
MKKTILKFFSVVMAICVLSTQSFSVYGRTVKAITPNIDESVFNLDEGQLSSDFAELNALESYLETNPDATYADLALTKSDLVSNLDNTSAPMGMSGDGSEAPLGIPSFLWGCILGVIGILLVYIVSDGDKAETKKALWGCAAWTILWVVYYVVVVAAVETNI